MVARKAKSHWPTYTATGLAIAITIALLVGWVLVVVFYTDAVWLLVLGIIGLVGVGVMLGVLLAGLASTSREVRRQRVFLAALGPIEPRRRLGPPSRPAGKKEHFIPFAQPFRLPRETVPRRGG